MVLETATGVETEPRGVRIGPDVRAPTAGFAQFDVVDPQRGPVLERRNLGDVRDAKDSANTFQLPLQGQQALGAASLHLAHHTTPEQATISNRVDDLGSFPQKIAGPDDDGGSLLGFALDGDRTHSGPLSGFAYRLCIGHVTLPLNKRLHIG